MRQLTIAEVEKFASRKGAKRIAVENFLMTIDTRIGTMGNRENAMMDARMYKWNAPTLNAILAGISLAGKGR